MIASFRCETGRIREGNEDRVFASQEPVGVLPNLLIVADGMGGHQAGEKASEICVEAFLEAVRKQETGPEDLAAFLALCAQEANEAVYEASCSHPEWRGMGTTLVAATVADGMLSCINIGDSRLYILRNGEEGYVLEQVSEDHSYVASLVRAGLLTKEEAFYHDQKNLITRAVGLEPYVTADQFVVLTEDALMLVLCSDGLSDMIQDDEIERILNLPGMDADLAAQNLLNKANENGGKDNISVIVADIRGDQAC